MPAISAVIITFNEEKFIDKCLGSLQGVADEIVVVDSFSTDRTPEICKQYNCRFIQHTFEGYREQKNWAMQQAGSDYILSLDGDEFLSEALKKSILEVKKEWKYDAYSFNRRNNFYGRWLRFSGTYPDRKIRLFNRRKAKWGGVNPHDKVILSDNVKKKILKGDLLHMVQRSPEDHLIKIKSFAKISANSYVEMGKKSSWFRMILSPFWRFVWNFFFRLGFLDGKYGVTVCLYNAYSSYLKHNKIREFSRAAITKDKSL